MVEDVLKVHRERQVVAFRGVAAATASEAATTTTASAAASAAPCTAAATSCAAKSAGTATPSSASRASAVALTLRSGVSPFTAKPPCLTDSQVGNDGTWSVAKVARNDLRARRRIWIEGSKPGDDHAGLRQIRGEGGTLSKQSVTV